MAFSTRHLLLHAPTGKHLNTAQKLKIKKEETDVPPLHVILCPSPTAELAEGFLLEPPEPEDFRLMVAGQAYPYDPRSEGF